MERPTDSSSITFSDGDLAADHEINTASELLSEVDPSDYFRLTAFRKLGRSLDPNPNHRWENLREAGIEIHGDNGDILIGETYDPISKTHGILLGESTIDGQKNFVNIQGLNQYKRECLFDAIASATPRFSDEQRHAYLKEIMSRIPDLDALTDHQISIELSKIVLRHIPDYETPHKTTEFQLDWVREQPSYEQQDEIMQFFQVVQKKLPEGKFNQRVKEFVEFIGWMDNPFGKSYPYLFTKITDWVMNDRNMNRQFEVLQRKPLAIYSIADKVTKQVKTEGELLNILKDLPIEEAPKTDLSLSTPKIAELVNLSLVVGGENIDDWFVSTSDGRGLSKIFEFTQTLQTGEASVAGNDQPILAMEVNGKYYIDGDGRHRTAALKALGVAEVPMLVRHIKK